MVSLKFPEATNIGSLFSERHVWNEGVRIASCNALRLDTRSYIPGAPTGQKLVLRMYVGTSRFYSYTFGPKVGISYILGALGYGTRMCYPMISVGLRLSNAGQSMWSFC